VGGVPCEGKLKVAREGVNSRGRGSGVGLGQFHPQPPPGIKKKSTIFPRKNTGKRGSRERDFGRGSLRALRLVNEIEAKKKKGGGGPEILIGKGKEKRRRRKGNRQVGGEGGFHPSNMDCPKGV